MAEAYVRIPADDVGKKLRTRLNTVGADDVHSEVFVLEDGNGNLLIPLSEAGTVQVSSGTVQVSNFPVSLNSLGTLNSGSLQYLGNIGTLPPITGTVQVGAGTVNVASMPTTTVQWANQTVGVTDGTLRTVTEVGTLPNIVVGSGTLQAISGNVNAVVQSGTLQTLNAGSLQYVGNVGTLPNVVVGSGTIQTLNNGTLTSIGSATVYAKHDLIVYDSAGTVCTGQGSLVQTASKIIKVHHYKAQADGTYAFHFADTKPNGGTLDPGWYFLQREGVVSPFIPYPGYLFKTTTAGSALCIGTWPSVPCNGTLRLTIVTTDTDTA